VELTDWRVHSETTKTSFTSSTCFSPLTSTLGTT
jgi:hypothetical protein